MIDRGRQHAMMQEYDPRSDMDRVLDLIPG